MNKQLTYYDTGEKIFKPGEDVYINKVCELFGPHLHAHDFIEIAYVYSGNGIHKIGNREYSVTKGDLFIINYNEPHEFRSLNPSPDAGLIVYNCIFKPQFLDYSLMNCKDFSSITHHFLFNSLFPEENETRADIKLLDKNSKEIEELYEKMYKEYCTRNEGYIEILRAYLIELLIIIFRLYRKNEQFDNKIEVQRRQVIEKTIQYMRDNYAHEIKLEDLSVMAFLSRNYFCKLFKESTGMTALEYAQKIRIEEACSRLKNTDGKVIDIAWQVGYKDLKFFNQIFKKITGKTPGEYRKS